MKLRQATHEAQTASHQVSSIIQENKNYKPAHQKREALKETPIATKYTPQYPSYTVSLKELRTTGLSEYFASIVN